MLVGRFLKVIREATSYDTCYNRGKRTFDQERNPSHQQRSPCLYGQGPRYVTRCVGTAMVGMGDVRGPDTAWRHLDIQISPSLIAKLQWRSHGEIIALALCRYLVST